MIVDTSALLAYFDRNEPRHSELVRVIDATDEPLVVSPYVVAELDYLVMTRHGTRAEQAVLQELVGGAWTLADMPVALVAQALAVMDRYADQPIGLADASNIVLAQAFQTTTIATLDRRHFSVLRFADGTAPRLLPG